MNQDYKYNGYTIIELEESSLLIFSKLSELGKGSQSTVLDVSDKVKKTAPMYEFQNLIELSRCPVDSLRMYDPIINGKGITFFQDKIKKEPINDKEYYNILIGELESLHKAGMAYNDLVKENVVNGHLIDPGLVKYVGDRLHKQRHILGDCVSSCDSDLIGLKIMMKSDGFDTNWKDLKGARSTVLSKYSGLDGVIVVIVCITICSMFATVISNFILVFIVKNMGLTSSNPNTGTYHYVLESNYYGRSPLDDPVKFSISIGFITISSIFLCLTLAMYRTLRFDKI